MELFNLAIQTIVAACSVLSVSLVIFGNWKKKQQDALKELKDTQEKELLEIKVTHKETIAELKAEFLAERADRVEKTARLHCRIDDMQKELIGDLRSDMSEIKGELKGVSNIMSVIQEWFINQNGKGKGD